MQAKLNELFSALSDATRRDTYNVVGRRYGSDDRMHPFDMSLPAISKASKYTQ